MLHRRHPRHAPTKLDSRSFRLGASASIAAIVLAGFVLTRTERGIAMLGQGVGFLEFYAGVFGLVLLTATVALGLITTERVFLSPANRVRAQLAHRATALIGMAYLITHISLMISLGHIQPGAAVVPIAGLYVGLGTLAFDLMIVAVVTGMLRGRFAVRTRPWVWRVMHSAAYLAWPIGIMHGLTAGRPPAGWVAWSYVASMAAVGSALIVRVLASLRRPPVISEKVAGPAVTAAATAEVPVERPQKTPVPAGVTAAQGNAPVSLAEARRRYREAG
ncbi:DMSO/TMAO reductase YedYZ, heme-binding membrane subunit [Nonomuraea solani]|uniref:DMSO/TMAO reductase YedYZ, heme-binding membrane subunit n=1 Tax=Nonomuraea solani TaxID=1144553 RepID=A0A1H6BYS6_9ACTN|nr:ferric reductase-like transmembrane domain-containing protein [Nonomuraea solani]SEG65851.1 DMSO/TMAO reductase YedYZ, heme-binding membrane subunit [Nonomuraea solani]